MKLQHLTFIRNDGLKGLDRLLVMAFKTRDDLAKPSDVLAALRRALSKWASTTEEGRAAWEESSEDYNIGDFLGDCENPQVLALLQEEGILHVEVAYELSSQEEVSYDRILMSVDD